MKNLREARVLTSLEESSNRYSFKIKILIEKGGITEMTYLLNSEGIHELISCRLAQNQYLKVLDRI